MRTIYPGIMKKNEYGSITFDNYVIEDDNTKGDVDNKPIYEIIIDDYSKIVERIKL